MAKEAAEVAQKKEQYSSRVSFIHNGSETTTWMGYGFKTKSTKSKAKQHLDKNIFFESRAEDH